MAKATVRKARLRRFSVALVETLTVRARRFVKVRATDSESAANLALSSQVLPRGERYVISDDIHNAVPYPGVQNDKSADTEWKARVAEALATVDFTNLTPRLYPSRTPRPSSSRIDTAHVADAIRRDGRPIR